MVELIGRRDELAVLRRVLESAATGSSTAVVVEGDAGIGKTRLLRSVAREAATSGVVVLRGGITESESTISWAGVSAMVDSLDANGVGALTRAQRHLLDRARGRASGGPVDANDVAGTLAEVVGRIAAASPVLLLLDDLHWLDRASAGAITVAIRSNLRRPVAIIAARRLRNSTMIDLDRIEGLPVERLPLSGLSVSGVYELLAVHDLAGLRRPDVLRVHELSQGNPLFAVELARLHVGGRRVSDVAEHDALRGLAIARLERVGPAAVEAARVSALLTQPTLDTVRAVVGPDADEGLLELEREGIITCDGNRLNFSHPLRREGTLESIGALERSRYHHRIAAAIDDLEQSIAHRGEAAQAPDADLAAALERIADDAAHRGATDVALVRYRRAEQLTPAADVAARWRRAHLAVRCSIALGDDHLVIDEAVRLFDEAAGDDATLDAALDVLEVRHRTQGLEAAAAFGPAGRARLAHSPRHEVVFLERIVRIEQLRDVPAAANLARAALELARASGDEVVVGRAQILRESTAVLAGEAVDLDHLPQVTFDRHPSGMDAMMFLAELLVWTYQFDRAEAVLRPMEVDARASGRGAHLVRVLSQLGDLHLRQGRWDESAAELEEAVEIGDLIGFHVGARPDLAALMAARGRSELAGELTDADVHQLESAPPVHRMQIHTRAGFTRLAAGDWHGAHVHLIRARDEARTAGFVAVIVLPIEHDLVEASVHVGDLATASDAATSLGAAADRAGSSIVSALACRSRALVAGALGDPDGAVQLVMRAVELHGDGPSVPFEEARTRLIAGTLLRRAGSRREARRQIGIALELFEQLDARAFEQRARSELDRLRGRQAPTGLSPTEDRVATLAASGRTNLEIATELAISVRTVESNLTRVYRKLGVRSRTELATKLARSS